MCKLTGITKSTLSKCLRSINLSHLSTHCCSRPLLDTWLLPIGILPEVRRVPEWVQWILDTWSRAVAVWSADVRLVRRHCKIPSNSWTALIWVYRRHRRALCDTNRFVRYRNCSATTNTDRRDRWPVPGTWTSTWQCMCQHLNSFVTMTCTAAAHHAPDAPANPHCAHMAVAMRIWWNCNKCIETRTWN